VKQLRAAGAERCFGKLPAGRAPDRTQIAPRTGATRQRRRVDGDAPRPPGALDARFIEHADTIAKAGTGFRSLGDAWADTDEARTGA